MRLFRYRGTFLQPIGMVFVLAFMVPLLGLSWAGYRLSQDALLQNSSVMMENTMELSKIHLESVLKEASFVHLHLIDSDDLLALLRKPPQNRGDEGIYLLTLGTLLESFKSIEEIRYIAWYPLDPSSFPEYRKYVLIDNYPETEWFEALRSKDAKPVWALEKVIRQDPLNSEWVLTQYRLLKDKESLRPLGIIGVSINERALSRHMLLPRNIRGQRLLVVDGQGAVFADTGSSQLGLPDDGFAARYLQPVQPDTESYWVTDGEGRKFVTQSLLEGTDWRLLSIIPEASLLHALPLLRTATFVLFVGYLAVGVWIAVYFFTRLMKPVTELANWMRQVEADNLVVRQPSGRGRGEIAYLSRTFQKLVTRLRGEIARIYETEREKKELEIQALNYQIRPHFLYNTLDTIKWRAAGGHADDVAAMIEALSGLLRATLRSADRVPLGEELQQVKYYVEIEQYRHRDRFTLMVDADEACLDAAVPRFILQPLVENAIRHGILKSEGPGVILIRISATDGELIIKVTDSGPGFPPDYGAVREPDADGTGGGIGLHNVHKRLQLLYGPSYRLSWSHEPGLGTTVRLALPAQGAEPA